MNIDQIAAKVQAALPRAVNMRGSGQLRAGAAFLMAGVRGWRWVGFERGDHVMRDQTGRMILVDLVARKASPLIVWGNIE